jgi:hypothetical protein
VAKTLTFGRSFAVLSRLSTNAAKQQGPFQVDTLIPIVVYRTIILWGNRQRNYRRKIGFLAGFHRGPISLEEEKGFYILHVFRIYHMKLAAS